MAAGTRDVTVVVRTMSYAEVEAEVREKVTARLQAFHDRAQKHDHSEAYLAGIKAGLLHISGDIDKPLVEVALGASLAQGDPAP